MAQKLLIVESPTKARTIGRMLGKDYKILASMGHVRDLPERSFGVDIENNFAPQYVTGTRGAKVVKELESAAKNASEIYLAPDPDREGEAIAWHLKEMLQKKFKGDFHRVTFHEITRSAIARALEEVSDIDMNKVDAQQARRVLDRIVGYQVSPLLWSRIAKGSSAGRVQSVALRLVVEREREIEAFTPQEYWNFIAQCLASDSSFEAKMVKIDGDKFLIDNGEEAARIADVIEKNGRFTVELVEKNERKRYAPPPFITSTLQQSASTFLKFSPSNTMRFAQELYEGVDLGDRGSVGLITYMRTDSVNIAKEAQHSCRDFIARTYGGSYVPVKPNFFKSKGNAQEAHEAIRPTSVEHTPESVAPYLNSQQLKLYTLIWKRFVASQMTPEVRALTTVELASGGDGHTYTFRATASVPLFAGFAKLFDDGKKEEEKMLNEKAAELFGRLKVGDECKLKELAKEQKFTEPPPRYSEASLIKALEENGIGRPSTYATIMRTIQGRDYVTKEKGALVPTKLGFDVTDFLVAKLPELFNVSFTSSMEDSLDAIEEGKEPWQSTLHKFYDRFSPWLADAKKLQTVDHGKTGNLVNLLGAVSFPKVEKGSRAFDEGKFYRSVKKRQESGLELSDKQFAALLGLAVKYQDQLPQLDALAAEDGFSNELQQARDKNNERQNKENAGGERQEGDYTALFAAFDGVSWDAPQTVRGRVYDDKKFFDSLKKQALEQGRILSDKQLSVLARMAVKYKDAIADFPAVAEALGVSADTAAEKGQSVQSGGGVADEGDALLEQLAKVTEWAPPEKKGRFTFNDKDFYSSLASQRKRGKNLSDKQLAALKKMAAKYITKE